jgi:hypothetical protein
MPVPIHVLVYLLGLSIGVGLVGTGLEDLGILQKLIPQQTQGQKTNYVPDRHGNRPGDIGTRSAVVNYGMIGGGGVWCLLVTGFYLKFLFFGYQPIRSYASTKGAQGSQANFDFLDPSQQAASNGGPAHQAPSVGCPHCGMPVALNPQMRGVAVACPRCHQPFVLP